MLTSPLSPEITRKDHTVLPRVATPNRQKSPSKLSRTTTHPSAPQTPEQLAQTVSKSIQHLSIQHAYDYLDKLCSLIENMKDAQLDSGAVSTNVSEDVDPDDWSAEDLGEDEEGDGWDGEDDDDGEGCEEEE